MRLKKYLTEGYHLTRMIKLKNGQKESDGEEYTNRKQALEILNIERGGDAGLDYDNIKDLHYFNDDDSFSVIVNGKLTKKELK